MSEAAAVRAGGKKRKTYLKEKVKNDNSNHTHMRLALRF